MDRSADSAYSGDAAQIQDLFNRIAPVYDAFNQQLSLGLHQIWKQMAVDWSRAQPGDTCLDLCCGSGDVTLLLSRRVGPSGQVYGVDFATAQLAIARQRSQKVWPPLVVDWVEADVLALPFEDAYFDGATMGYGLRNVADIPASLKELRRVLKPGSAAAILDFHRPASSLMQKFQQWYLSTIVVPTAEAYGLGSEYAYISPSLDRFLSGSAQVSSALQSGFSDAVHYPIVGGMMGVLVATR